MRFLLFDFAGGSGLRSTQQLVAHEVADGPAAGALEGGKARFHLYRIAQMPQGPRRDQHLDEEENEEEVKASTCRSFESRGSVWCFFGLGRHGSAFASAWKGSRGSESRKRGGGVRCGCRVHVVHKRRSAETHGVL
eukprot:1832446-Rhodomonas_salina.1